jgi:hypothetical protein
MIYWKLSSLSFLERKMEDNIVHVNSSAKLVTKHFSHFVCIYDKFIQKKIILCYSHCMSFFRVK